jgi:ketosteroid isomerase-like protein
MSQENVEAFRRAVEAYNRRDIDAFLAAFDPAVETHPLTLAMFGQEATVYRGHEGIRQFVRDVEEALAEVRVGVLEIRDLGERIVSSGRLRARGRASGAEIESPVSWLIEFKDGRVIRMRDFLDFKEALKAAGLSE